MSTVISEFPGFEFAPACERSRFRAGLGQDHRLRERGFLPSIEEGRQMVQVRRTLESTARGSAPSEDQYARATRASSNVFVPASWTYEATMTLVSAVFQH
jgi:hypothetical protein